MIGDGWDFYEMKLSVKDDSWQWWITLDNMDDVWTFMDDIELGL
jgi:hypothetical protein